MRSKKHNRDEYWRDFQQNKPEHVAIIRAVGGKEELLDKIEKMVEVYAETHGYDNYEVAFEQMKRNRNNNRGYRDDEFGRGWEY